MSDEPITFCWGCGKVTPTGAEYCNDKCRKKRERDEKPRATHKRKSNYHYTQHYERG